MSATIKAAITALKARIAAAYSAISAKGGTLPATQDSDNLASAIATIPSGGGGFDTSIMTGMAYAFIDYSGDKPDLSQLDTSNVTRMDYMFYNFWRNGRGDVGDRIIDISHFDTSEVTNMQSMFTYTGSEAKFNFGTFDTSKVTSMQSMFSYATVPYPLPSGFDTSNVSDFRNMFNSSNNYTDHYDLSVMRFDSAGSSTLMASFLAAMNNVTELLYGHTLAEVEAGTCVLFKNLKFSSNIRNVPLDYKNMLACAKGVYDLATAGLTTQTFTLRKATFEAMTAQEQATIQTTFTNKGWTLALAN